MDPANLILGLALLAGLASFLSPCVLALVPAYVGYLGGRSVGPGGTAVASRGLTFAHGVAFVTGFSLVFILLGIAASALGGILFDLREWIARIGGVIVILFGLQTLGVINIPVLNMDTRKQYTPAAGGSFLSSGLMGVFFLSRGGAVRWPRPGSCAHACAKWCQHWAWSDPAQRLFGGVGDPFPDSCTGRRKCS